MHRYGGLPAPLAVARRAGAGGLPARSTTRAAMAAFAALERAGAARARPAVRGALAAGRTAARHLVHRISLGRRRLRACRRAAVGRWRRWIGVHGIGFVAALLAYRAVAACLDPARCAPGATGRRWRGCAALLAACNLAAAPGRQPAPQPRLSVALLQGNIPQDEKFQGGTGIPVALDWYGRQLRDSTASLVVAPETAIPMLPQQLPDGYLEALRARFAQGRQAALIGIPLGGMREGYTNSAIGLKPGADVYRFDKHHLVPFGEFIPPLFRWFTDMMNIPLGDFNRGPHRPAVLRVAGPAAGAQHLLRGPVRRRTGRPVRRPGHGAHHLRQHQQHRLVRQHGGHRPAPAHQPHAGAGVRAADDPRHQHRGHRDHRPPRPCDAFPAAPHPRRADRRRGGPQHHHALCRWVSRLGLWPLWLLALVVAALGVWRQRAASSVRPRIAGFDRLTADFGLRRPATARPRKINGLPASRSAC